MYCTEIQILCGLFLVHFWLNFNVYNIYPFDHELHIFVRNLVNVQMFNQERDISIEGVTSQTMLEYLPCPDKTRNKLLELMNSHKGNIFTDLSVHMLMVYLILFDSQDVDSNIR